jgi:hypothetical protein
MQAKASPQATRWTLAIDRARALVGGAGGRDIVVATTAEGVVAGPTRDVTELLRVLDRLTPGGGPDGGWPQVSAAAEVHLLTDGAVQRPIDPGVIVDSVFVPAANVAVTAFDVQPVPTSPAKSVAYVSVTNYASAAQMVHITLARGADVLVNRDVSIAGGETFRDALPVPSPGDPRFRVHVSAADNALEMDDDAVSWLWAAQRVRVGIVRNSPDSTLADLLGHDAGLQTVIVDPASYATATADVWIFDRWLPPAAPSSPALILEPPASSWAGPIARQESDPAWQTTMAHPVLEGVDVEFLRLQKAVALGRAPLRPIALSREGTPLVSVEDGASGRLVVLGFSTTDSNIASLSALPLLVANAIDWLARSDRNAHRRMGPLALPAATTAVTSPTGQSVPLSRSGDFVTATLRAPGLYRIDTRGTSRVLIVGLDDPARSNLLVSTLAPAAARPPAAFARVRPLWMLATCVAVALLTIEWLTWLRRVTV